MREQSQEIGRLEGHWREPGQGRLSWDQEFEGKKKAIEA